MERPKVGILLGSESDSLTMQKAAQVLKEMVVPYEMRSMSAHRLPDVTADYARTARERGLEVIICGAGTILAIRRDKQILSNLHGEMKICANDALFVLGPPEKIARISRLFHNSKEREAS